MTNLFMRFPGGKSRAFTMSYDDGVEQDVKLIAIMRKHGVKGTFNLNAGLFAKEGTVYPAGTIHRRMTLEACKKAYAGGDMEVACHGYTHPFLEQLPASLCNRQILDDRQALENEFGTLVRGAAYPYGSFSDGVVEALRASGIVYCRTTISTCAFQLPSDWLRLPATCHHNNPQLMELADKFLSAPNTRGPLLFYLWGHAYEFEANDNWDVIEKFLDKIAQQDEVWYATNIEIYDYIQAYKQLIFSCDGSYVMNPTAKELWFRIDSNNYRIGAGETLKL